MGESDEVNDRSSSRARSEERFRALIQQVRHGSQDAAWTLLETYGPHVHRVVRRMLRRELRPKFDSIDFVQSVWLSFFANRSKIHDFNTSDDLVAFLARLAQNKVTSEVRRRVYSKKRDVRREQSLSAGDSGDPIARGPTASDFAIAHERWNQFLSGQPDDYRLVLKMKLSGATNDEIAVKLGVNERTVRRIVVKLRQLGAE